ncbi:hypothetical protein OIU77_028434 [Salix suchowensis]|uniref:Wax synthase domain-containing protein n=1 Tax=Salix suchowensis TaxID=1278906 RepID=A0ABQ9BJH3_9ROSI|nr:hypothetical protein OIU77_028434 [Salix suchowensis]
MEDELSSFLKVWVSVFFCICCCYAIGKTIPKGRTRFLFLIPFVCLFFYLPLNLSTIFLGGNTAFYIAWLGNFKLLLYAFGEGPLSSQDSSRSLLTFVCVACFPIKIQENPPPKSQKQENQPPVIHPDQTHKSPLNYAIKGLILAFLSWLEPSWGLELEPQFNEPHLSTSLQDFWGKRWNLMVSSILRQTVYEPTRNISKRFVGRRWSPIPAVLATFLLSAIMHEVMFYYLLRVKPTWEVTWFFLLHGFCVTLEIAIKKALKGRWQLPRLISGLFTVGFVLATSCWLFFPKPLKCRADARAFEEYAALRAFGSDCSHALFGRPSITRSH